jgi:tetratricopeptide (TPR) repeat protein
MYAPALTAFSAVLLLTTAKPDLIVATSEHRHSPSPSADLVRLVSQRLLAIASPVTGMQWPPLFETEPGDAINAYASLEERQNGPVPRVAVSQGILSKIVEGEADRLAFILGHELGHVVLGHVVPKTGADKTPFVQAAFNRDQEITADRKGMELVLAAGYSYRGALKGIHRMIELGLQYSSFEALAVDHPSWKDRLALLDRDQASLWRVMSAFDNGALFIAVEQYLPAERCFRAIVKEFPSCHEAWANLGYCLLMQYCDALDTDDVRRFNIGQIVCGGFYRRPQSLETQVRGVDEDLWWEAVGALREALRLNPNLTLAKANLGIAYLVRPAGKDIGQATRHLQEAAEAAQSDSSLDPPARVAVLVNSGVAELAGGRREVAQRKLDEGEQVAARYARNRRKLATVFPTAAIAYNRALLLADSSDADQRPAAASQFEKYLQTSAPTSVWWPLAYERYSQLCKDRGLPGKTKEALAAKAQSGFRPLVSVEFGRQRGVSLGEAITEVNRRLGEPESVPVVPGTNLARLHYRQQGVDLVANERVLAICLSSSSRVALELRPAGVGTKLVVLRSDMTKQELETALADDDYDFRQLSDPDVNYRFYRNIGLAVRIQRERVEQLVVVQIPDRSILGD